MRVFIDGLSLYSGGARTHLKDILAQPSAPSVTLLTTRTLWEELRLDGMARPLFAPKSTHNAVSRAAWRKAFLSETVRKSAVDVYFDPAGGAPQVGVPRVTMIRNMLPFDRRVKEWYGRLTYQGLRLAALRRHCLEAAASAEGTIFVSEWSRSQCIRLLRRLPARSCVIPHGVERRLVERHRPWPERPRLLYVSDLSPYKRQEELVLAYDIARARGLRLGELELAGAFTNPGYAARLKAMVKSLRFGREVRLPGWLGRSELRRAMDEADSLVFVSSVECCPNILLESLASGKPVLCSQEPPMPEFAGDCAVYVDPADPLALADGLRRLIQMPERERQAMADRALARAARYDWVETARRTWQFVEEVAKQGRTPVGAGDMHVRH